MREVCGFAPYEKRIIELLKAGSSADVKKAYRFAKQRLGSHTQAIRKRDEMANHISE